MGDKKTKSEEERAEASVKFVQIGIDNVELRDELFVQVIKQCTKTKAGIGSTGIRKGYEMLGLCLTAFFPSTNMENFVIMFIRRAPDLKLKRAYMSQYHETKYDKPKVSGKVDISSISKAILDLGNRNERSRFSVAMA